MHSFLAINPNVPAECAIIERDSETGRRSGGASLGSRVTSAPAPDDECPNVSDESP